MTQEIKHHVFTSGEARRFRLKEKLHVFSLAAGAKSKRRGENCNFPQENRITHNGWYQE